MYVDENPYFVRKKIN